MSCFPFGLIIFIVFLFICLGWLKLADYKDKDLSWYDILTIGIIVYCNIVFIYVITVLIWRNLYVYY